METQTVAKKIKQGKIGIFPTETAYGIAADAMNAKAVEKVYQAKNRPKEKPLTVICKNLDQVKQYAYLTEVEKEIIKEFMPGPLTLIAEKKEKVPDILNEDFAFRISSNKKARQLAKNNPITATSANISNQPTSYEIEDISEKLREKMDFIIDEGKLEPKPTSTIAEVNNREIEIHREGPVKKEDLQEVLD